MSKIKIETNLKTKETTTQNKLKGIKKNNKIIFYENNIQVNITIEKDKIIMVRKTSEYKLILEFEKFLTIDGKYDIKDIGRLDIKTKTKDLIINENKIYISYILYIDNKNLGHNTYELEYEEIK